MFCEGGSGILRTALRSFICYTVLLVFFSSGGLSAQSSLLKFDNYTKDDGLLHSYILSITQDHEGFIWIGSCGGLNRFDGSNFKSYRPDEYEGLNSSIIHCIYEPVNNPENILWIGAETGLIRFSKKEDRFYYMDLIHSPVFAIAEEDNGVLLLGTRDNGLLKFDPETNHTGSISGITDQVNVIYIERPGVIWLGTLLSGLIKYEEATDRRTVFSVDAQNGKNITHNTITSILRYGNKLYIGTWGGGINIIDLSSNQSSLPVYDNGNSQLFHSIVTDITADNKGNLWCATQGGGLYRLIRKSGEAEDPLMFEVKNYRSNPNTTDALCSNMLKRVYKDRTGNIWIGSTGGALSKIDFYKQKFKHYLIVNDSGYPIEDNNISSICMDKEGKIWYGTRNSGIYVYEKEKDRYKQILPYPGNINDPRNSIRTIYKDRYKRLWVGTDYGFFLYYNALSPPVYYGPDKNRTDGLPGHEVIAIQLDKDDALWISVDGAGLSRLSATEINKKDPSGAGFENFFYLDSTGDGLLSAQIWSIYCDTKKNLWFATSGGLETFDYEKRKFIPQLYENFSTIYEVPGSDNRFFWLGTFGKGLYLFNHQNKEILFFNTGNGFPNNNINGILEDATGNIWISTGKGLARIETEGLYADSFNDLEESIPYRIRIFSKSEGLQGHEFNLNAREVPENGNLIFGGPKGYNMFNPIELPENNYIFPVVITDFKLYNKSVIGDEDFKDYVPEYTPAIVLNYKQNYFTIDYTEICFTSPEKVNYQYMLEGFDQNWIPADARHNSATYTGLKDGRYLFKIRAANGDGHWGESMTKLEITITPPFWRRLVFRIFLYFIITGILLLGFYFQSRFLTKKKEKELEYQKSTFERDKLKYDLDYKTKELASSAIQMAKRNEKLNEIKEKLVETSTIARSEVSSRIKSIISEIDNDLKNQSNWESFELNFNLIHNNFITRLAEAYPSLSQTDIKICAFMRMNLSSKEIAELLNITQASLETSRIRIRKKLDLDSSVYLSNFILRF